MRKINIVLYEPEIPQNTGNISRTAAVTGAALHMIKPFGFEVTDRHLKRAGLDYWSKLDVTYYENWQDFLEQNKGAELYYFTAKGISRINASTMGDTSVKESSRSIMPPWPGMILP